METGDARNGRPQSALHHEHRVDRWRSDRKTISTRALYRSDDLEISRERHRSTQRRTELVVREGGRKHRARDVTRWTRVDEARRLSAGQCPESSERQTT